MNIKEEKEMDQREREQIFEHTMDIECHIWWLKCALDDISDSHKKYICEFRYYPLRNIWSKPLAKGIYLF